MIRLLIQRLPRPREGWDARTMLGIVIVLAAALGVLAWAVQNAGWTRGSPGLIAPTLLAMLIGLLLTRRPRPAWRTASLALLSSLLFLPLTAAQAWPPLRLLFANLRGLMALLRHPQEPFPALPLPLWMSERLGQWAQDMAAWALAGQREANDLPFAFLILLLLWLAGLWAGWQTFRYRGDCSAGDAWTALAPAGAVLAANSFFTFAGLGWLLLFMATLLTLALILREGSLRQQWETQRIDYSPELRLEVYAFGLALTLGILALMPLAPTLRLRPLQRAFWRLVETPYTRLETQLETLFPALDRSGRGLLPGGTLVAGGLPRAHLLTAGPDLRQQVILHVAVDDATMPAANLRWRGLTFEQYNGRGWDPPQIVEIARFGPGEMWLPPQPGRRLLRQTIEFVAEESFWLYAAGEPVAADRSYRAHLRGPGDAAGLEVQAGAYMVLSQTPAVTAAALAAAGPPPAEIAARYLALPAGLPDRVPALARALTADAATPYDQAQALESYLRRFPYTLDLPAPPPDVDVVDYFLFELQQGYCDYYAASMVVLARSLGLPARLAVGYAAGVYDPARGRFTVTEADAHSWPELYFQGAGWIPFEPTAAQPRFDFTPAQTAESAPFDLAAEQRALRARGLRQGLWRWTMPKYLSAGLLGVLLLGAAARLLWGEWRLRRRAAHAWQLAYLRLQRWGQRLHLPAAAGDTPREYAARWRAAPYPPLVAAIDRLSQGLEARAYAPPGRHPPEATARQLWRGLRPWLWRLWLARWRGR